MKPTHRQIYYVVAVVVVVLEREKEGNINRFSNPADVLFISELFLLFLCRYINLVHDLEHPEVTSILLQAIHDEN